jgi:hypothetical protein
MEPNQHRHRQSADEKFQESLEELESILQKHSQSDTTEAEPDHSSEDVSTDIDLAELEDAVADIENYLDQKRKKQ